MTIAQVLERSRTRNRLLGEVKKAREASLDIEPDAPRPVPPRAPLARGGWQPLQHRETFLSPLVVIPDVAVGTPERIDEWIKTTYGTKVKILLTPEVAHWILETKQLQNRVLRKSAIRAYAAIMKDRAWLVNGEPIIFSREGWLNNGEHRLHAIATGGFSVVVDIRFGVDRSTVIAVDSGIARTGGDSLHIALEEHSATLSSALTWLHAFETNTIEQGKSRNLPRHRMHEMRANHPELPNSVAFVTKEFPRKGSPLRAPHGLFAMLHYICWLESEDTADKWFAKLSTGLDLASEDDPINRLRGHLTQPVGKYGLVRLGAFVIKAWNYFCEERPVRVLKWLDNEKWPKPRTPRWER